jgi:hypothetical protein
MIKMAKAPPTKGAAAKKNRVRNGKCIASKIPPMTGPANAPIRPTPNAQPDPVVRMWVGYSVAESALMVI